MIYLITGLPGNGKTLYSLWHIRERAKKENRQVYISGVPNLAIPDWNQIDEEQAKDWHSLPDGSIIVIDEAQRIFRPRAGRGEPPPHVANLETHRHKGFDIYLITQHPSLIDQNVRRLSGTHRHIQRTFGLSRAVIHEWGEVHLDCELRRTDSSKTVWNYPKDVYSLYKSAELHTHKAQLPKQVWYIVICVAILVALSVFLYQRISARASGDAPGTENKAPAKSPASDLTAKSSGRDEPLTTDEYIAALTPRIPNLPHTAPRYDKITEATDAPYPVGCFTVGDKCKCVTQQGTPFKTTPDICQNFVRNGFFKDWGTEIKTTASDRTDKSNQTNKTQIAANEPNNQSIHYPTEGLPGPHFPGTL